ncbi:hypothetical protein AAG906_020535 [Vitis piasezkii]
MFGQVVRHASKVNRCRQKLYHDVVARHFNLLEPGVICACLCGPTGRFGSCGNYPGSIEGNDTWTNTWRGVPTMWTGYMSLQITPPFMGHVSFGDSMRVAFIEVTIGSVTLGGLSKGTHKHFVLQLLLWYDRENLWLGLPRASVCQQEGTLLLLARLVETRKLVERVLVSDVPGRKRFRISNGVFVLLVDDDPTPIEKQSHNAIYFTNEQFNLVMGLLDSNKGGPMRHILVLGPWVGLLESSDREFHLHHSLQIPGKKRRGWLIKWCGEHHVLKDLPFYEVAHATDPKARQDRLDQRKKKREEGRNTSASLESIDRSSFRQEILHKGTRSEPIRTFHQRQSPKLMLQGLVVCGREASYWKKCLFEQGMASINPDPLGDDPIECGTSIPPRA